MKDFIEAESDVFVLFSLFLLCFAFGGLTLIKMRISIFNLNFYLGTIHKEKKKRKREKTKKQNKTKKNKKKQKTKKNEKRKADANHAQKQK